MRIRLGVAYWREEHKQSTLRRRSCPCIPSLSVPSPEETIRIAQATFPRGDNTYMRMRDELGVIWEDEDFTGLFPKRGQPALAPWRLALVTVMQFAENLSDRQAANAVRARIDWKYALSLELTDPGFDFSVLSEFRTRGLSIPRTISSAKAIK